MIDARFSKKYPGFNFDVQLQAGTGITAVFGPSGAGKSLLLDCIAGFVKPDGGRLLIEDQLLFDAKAGVNVPPRLRHCGYVFQNYALFPHMTLRENMMFAASCLSGRERHRRVNEALDRFRIMDSADRKPHEVSGGQKQRCSIARALIGTPKVLLLDEPARGLDAPLREDLYTMLREITTPVILVTHSLRESLDLANEMIVVREGSIVQKGSPAEVTEKPASVELARLFGIYNVLPAEIRLLDPGRNTSVLRVGEWEVQGEYIPGHLKGDRVHLLVAPQQLRARARSGKANPNEIAAKLVRGIDTPYYTRLEFQGDLAVEMPPGQVTHNEDYWVEFPTRGLRVL